MITSWYDSATKMFGYEKEETEGQPITILIPKDHLDEEIEILRKIGQDESIYHYETERLTKAGKIINISLTISPIITSDGVIVGASKIARNISEDVLIRKKIKLYMHELEMLNKLKDEAINLISHELKTPLTSTKAYGKGSRFSFL